ncbi:MAG: hypothetical protein L3J71_14625 [Victivallaceae bacterium]|nr:hypothetical protein [Victivallaceae bacterium]
MVEEEIGELTAKLQEFLRIIELVKPARFITGPLSWCGLGASTEKTGKFAAGIFSQVGLQFTDNQGVD